LNASMPIVAPCEFVRMLPRGDASALREAIERGRLQVEYTGPTGYTLLHTAIAMGNADAVAVLLEHGADPNKPASRFRRPLHMAHARPAMLLSLIRHGADVGSEVVDDIDGVRMGETALHWAARGGVIESCRILVAHVAQPGYVIANPYEQYLTPAQAAVAAGRQEVFHYFVTECGEDPFQTTRSGKRLEQLAPSGFGVRSWLDRIRSSTRTHDAVAGAVGDVIRDEESAQSVARSSAPSL
jgi:ankyrin repeat protein